MSNEKRWAAVRHAFDNMGPDKGGRAPLALSVSRIVGCEMDLAWSVVSACMADSWDGFEAALRLYVDAAAEAASGMRQNVGGAK